MAEPRTYHAGPCNDWCADWGCGRTRPNGGTPEPRFWGPVRNANAGPLTAETFTDVLRNEYIEPVRQQEGAFARAFREEMRGAQEDLARQQEREAELLGLRNITAELRTVHQVVEDGDYDPPYVGNEVRIPVRRARNATAHWWNGGDIPPAAVNYAEYRWLPDQDIYITPTGERITGQMMAQLVEDGNA